MSWPPLPVQTPATPSSRARRSPTRSSASPANDILVGFDGDDLLEGGAGADELFGSTGFDTVSYKGSPAGVSHRIA